MHQHLKATRRGFVASGIACLGGMVTAVRRSRAQEQTGGSGRNGGCLDYGRSFILGSVPENSVRLWVESRTTIIDESTGDSTEFYQCGACKSEDLFGTEKLFREENYDFTPVFGGKEAEDQIIFRRWVGMHPGYRGIRKSENAWGKPILKLRPGKPVRVLETWEAIRDATAAGVPLVTQTEISNPDTGLRAIIECPVKTMNIGVPNRRYQTDTGPIIFPDLTRRFKPLIGCLSLAFIAFNAPDFAALVIEQPTPVLDDDGKELCKVYHYSNPLQIPAKNRVLAVGTGD